MTNKVFSTSNKVFKKACELATVKPTVRQASKFRIAAKNKIFKGMASRFRVQAVAEVK